MCSSVLISFFPSFLFFSFLNKAKKNNFHVKNQKEEHSVVLKVFILGIIIFLFSINKGGEGT